MNNVDLLDTARSRGYVQYSITAPAEPSAQDCIDELPPYHQDGVLATGPSSGGGSPASTTSTGTITVDWAATDPCPVGGVPLLDPGMAALAAVATTATLGVRRRWSAGRSRG